MNRNKKNKNTNKHKRKKNAESIQLDCVNNAEEIKIENDYYPNKRRKQTKVLQVFPGKNDSEGLIAATDFDDGETVATDFDEDDETDDADLSSHNRLCDFNDKTELWERLHAAESHFDDVDDLYQLQNQTNSLLSQILNEFCILSNRLSGNTNTTSCSIAETSNTSTITLPTNFATTDSINSSDGAVFRNCKDGGITLIMPSNSDNL